VVYIVCNIVDIEIWRDSAEFDFPLYSSNFHDFPRNPVHHQIICLIPSMFESHILLQNF